MVQVCDIQILSFAVKFYISLSQEVKDCSVVLDRIHMDERALKKELEEKEDMNRKGGKPVSRIPTFQKRPGGGGQTTELPAARKDAPAHAAQASEKAGSGGVETLKSRLPEVRETALPPLSVRLPAVRLVTSSPTSSVEQASHTSLMIAPKTKSLSESPQGLLLIASPRPPLRPEQDVNKTSRTEAGSAPEGPLSSLPQESILSQKLDEEHPGIPLTAGGDAQKPEETADTAEVGQVGGIMDEEPPWETEPTEAADPTGSRSTSDAECDDDDPASETSEGHDSEDVKGHQETLESQTELPDLKVKKANMDESTSAVAQEKPAKERTAKSTAVSSTYDPHVFYCDAQGRILTK